MIQVVLLVIQVALLVAPRALLVVGHLVALVIVLVPPLGEFTVLGLAVVVVVVVVVACYTTVGVLLAALNRHPLNP